MEKIPASKIIEADPEFVDDLWKKIKAKREQEDEGTKEFDSDQAALYLNVTAQTVRNHIKNYVRNREGKKIKAVKKGNRYIILKRDLDHYKSNPKTTL